MSSSSSSAAVEPHQHNNQNTKVDIGYRLSSSNNSTEEKITILNSILEIHTKQVVLDILSVAITCSSSNSKENNEEIITSFQDLTKRYESLVSKSMCSSVWKSDTYIYKCIECQMDENCALCMDCFEKDKHEGHRYRLVPSFRGACDCGDISAWKKEGWCHKHGQTKSPAHLPINLQPIIHLLTKVLLSKLNQIKINQGGVDNWMIQDETIDIKLVLSIGDQMMLEKIILIFNSLIDLLGDDVVQWCAEEFKNNSMGKKSIAIILLLLSNIKMDPLERFVISLFVSTELRDQIALCLVDNYDLLRSRLDRSKEKALSLTVQLFNVDTIAYQLVSTQKFKILVKHFLDIFDPQQVKSKDFINFHIDIKQHEKLDVYDRTLVDINYIIRNKSTLLYFLENPSQLFELLTIFYSAQEMYKNTRVTTTHIDYEDETWLFTYNLEFYLKKFLIDSICHILNQLIESKDLKVQHLLLLKNYTIDLLDKYYNQSEIGKIQWKKGLRDIQIPEYRVTKQPISIHLVLHRFLFKLLYIGTKHFNLKPIDFLKKDNSQLIKPALIIDPILRLYAFLSQVRSGLWVRNGNAVLYQSQLYLKNDDLCQPDFYLLQYCILCMEPQALYAQILDRSELATFFILDGLIQSEVQQPLSPASSSPNKSTPINITGNNNNNTSSSFSSSPLSSFLSTIGGTVSQSKKHLSDSDKNNLNMAEDLLALLISLVSDRSKLSDYTTEQYIRRDLIHMLAVGNATHSHLTDRHSERKNYSQFDTILDSVAIYHPPTNLDKGTYELRTSCWSEWDAYYPLYTRAELQKAEENYQRYFNQNKNLFNHPYYRPIRPLEPALPTLTGIEKILHCDMLHAILYTIIYNSVSESPKVNDVLLTHALHLITLTIISSDQSNVTLNNQNNNTQKPTVPKFETMDFGYHSSDFMVNLFHPVVKNSSSHHFFFTNSKSNENGYSLYSLLVSMFNSPKFELHNGILEKILKHPLVKNLVPTSSGSTPSSHDSLKGSTELSKSPDLLSQKEIAKKRQQEIMMKFSQQQRDFLKHSNSNSPKLNSSMDLDDMDMDINNNNNNNNNDNDDEDMQDKESQGTCTICKEEMCKGSTTFGYIGYVDRHAIMSSQPYVSPESQTQKPKITSDLFKDVNASKAAFVTFCSHMMHLDCHFKLIPKTNEELPTFQCPCCRRLSNITLPFCFEVTKLKQLVNGFKQCKGQNNIEFNSWIYEQIVHENEQKREKEKEKEKEKEDKEKQELRTANQNPESQLEREQLQLQKQLQLQQNLHQQQQLQQQQLQLQIQLQQLAQLQPQQQEQQEQRQQLELQLQLQLQQLQLRIQQLQPRQAELNDQAQHQQELLQRMLLLRQQQSAIGSKEDNDRLLKLMNLIISTLSLMELYCRGTFRPIKIQTALTDQYKTGIQNMVNLLINKMTTEIRTKNQQDYNSIIHTIFNVNNNNNNQNNQNINILNIETFGLFVRLFLTNQSNDNQVLNFNSQIKLIYLITLIQSICCIKKDITMEEMVNYITNPSEPLKRILLPWLRKMAIFLLVVEYPSDSLYLNQIEESNTDNEYQSLLIYLDLQSFNKSLIEYSSNNTNNNNNSDQLIKLVYQFWIGNIQSNEIITPPQRTYEPLIFGKNLPTDYHQFFIQNNHRECDGCHQKLTKTSLLCLYCNKIFCNYNEYVNHDYPRCSDIGAFLQLSEGNVVITYFGRAIVWGSIYLDQHGDEDIGLRRGRPLYFNQARFDRLVQDIMMIRLQNLMVSNR